MSALMIDADSICAIVVTYFPKSGLAQNLSALASQVRTILIVDNGSSEECLAMIDQAALSVAAVVVRLGANQGIAMALNVGLRMARERGFLWVATFDQDSQVTPGMIKEMALALQTYPQRNHVAIVTPCHVDRQIGHTVRERRHAGVGEGWRVIFSTMTSGNLVNLDAASAVGDFDGSLFIDYVDHEFCLRLRDHGYLVLEATRAVLRHSLGNMERRLLLVKRVTVTNHVPVRRYYMSRNRLIIWRRYWRRQPVWVLIDIRRFLFETMYLLLFEKQTNMKIKMLLRGLRHGLKGIRGEYDPNVG
jgi:rhamnosyltransferase